MLSASRNPFIVLEWSFVSQKLDNPNIEFGSAKVEPKFNIRFHEVWTQNSGPKFKFTAKMNAKCHEEHIYWVGMEFWELEMR